MSTGARTDPSVTVLARSQLPTRHGTFDLTAFRVGAEGHDHLLLSHGELGGRTPLVRVHSECLTGDGLGSLRCDCGEQLQTALHLIANGSVGALVYLRGHEGRGIGLAEKVRAYALQDGGLDTVQANLALGHPVDARDYTAAADVLRHVGVQQVRLLTNNPDKVRALEARGVRCVTVVPMPSTVTAHNERYLRTKQADLGHLGLVREPA